MTKLTRYTPMYNLSQLHREVDQLFDDFFGHTRMTERNGDAQSVWSPVVDLRENDEAYMIHMDLPGLSKGDVQIIFENGLLQISGERRNAHANTSDQVHRLERWHGRFFRSFTLGQNVQVDKITATFQDGVLNVVVPKVEESKPRTIKVS